MRLFIVTLLCCGTGARALLAYQQLVPIVRDIQTSSAPSVAEWKTFVQMADYGGTRYVSVVQMAELFNGHVRWFPVSKQVDLSIHNRTIRFSRNSPRVWVNGRQSRLEKPTVKNEDGFWIPVSFFASKIFFHAARSKLDWPPAERKASLSSSPAVAGGGPKHLETSKAVSMGSPPVTAGNDEQATPVPAKNIHAIRRIVIDPGHGGKDPGAVGPHGVEEKAINLLIAQDLAEALRAHDAYEVLLTRTDDTFVPLEARSALANSQNADLFISLHCNASLSSRLKGYEVYFLSERASDPHADAVARFENAPLALEGKQVPSPNQVAAVLRSLVKTANINEASALGTLMDRRMGERLSEPSLGVKQAAFYVLRGAEMPAILVETAFLTNANEERLLQDASFRGKVVAGIQAAIANYDERKHKERR